MARKSPKHFTGLVSILGRPNAGKSTLLNALMGQKIAIVAPKPQTTRTSIQGVLTLENSQIVFLDTPGIHRSDSLINRRMMQSVRDAAQGRDLLLFLADASTPPGPEDRRALDVVKSAETPVFLVLNKVDRVSPKTLLLERIEQYKTLHDFAEYFTVSALKRQGLEDLTKTISRRLPEGPPMFPPDYLTDQPERFLAAELIREKILRGTHQEVPHSVAVVVEEWTVEGRLVRRLATVYVERAGHKAILIGKGGEMLKKIGSSARLDIEKLLDRRVFLELFVKVRDKWREDPQFLNEIDWRGLGERG